MVAKRPSRVSSPGVPLAMTRAAVDDVDLVGEVLGLVHVVRREHDGHAVGAHLLEQLPRRTPCLRVHAGGGLVDEDQLGAADQRDRQAEPLLLAAGEPAVGRPAAVAPGRAAR